MLCTVVSFASCRNDGDDEELGGGTTGQPPVITFDNGTGIYTVKIMKSITITPLVNDATDPVYTWKDEKGKIVCTDLSYTYSPKAEGEVYFKFRVDAKNGYAEEELRVDVVEKMIPSVSLIPAYSTYMGKSVTLESSVNFTEGAKYEWVSIDESGKTKGTKPGSSRTGEHCTDPHQNYKDQKGSSSQNRGQDPSCRVSGLFIGINVAVSFFSHNIFSSGGCR